MTSSSVYLYILYHRISFLCNSSKCLSQIMKKAKLCPICQKKKGTLPHFLRVLGIFLFNARLETGTSNARAKTTFIIQMFILIHFTNLAAQNPAKQRMTKYHPQKSLSNNARSVVNFKLQLKLLLLLFFVFVFHFLGWKRTKWSSFYFAREKNNFGCWLCIRSNGSSLTDRHLQCGPVPVHQDKFIKRKYAFVQGYSQSEKKNTHLHQWEDEPIITPLFCFMI